MKITNKVLGIVGLVLVISLLFGKAKSNVVVVPLDDGFFVIPIGCPLNPVNCSANPICNNAKVKDSGDARVIVTTDIGGDDPDDYQSLVHLMTFADRVDIEGIASAPPRHGTSNSASRNAINTILNAYSADRPKLMQHYGPDFPLASSIAVLDGARNHHAIGNNSNYNTQAVQHIISRARCGWHNGDKRPLYLLGWGGITDIAQAIHQAPDIKKVIRIVSYSRWNNGNYNNPNNDDCTKESSWTHDRCRERDNLQDNHSDLWWVDYTGGYRPIGTCDNSVVNNTDGNSNVHIIPRILAGGNLGAATPLSDESVCTDGNGTNIAKHGAWLKLGDTWTVMFTHNPASIRNNPTGNSASQYGHYNDPSWNNSNSYWQLNSSEFNGRSTLYSEWVDRADKL